SGHHGRDHAAGEPTTAWWRPAGWRGCGDVASGWPLSCRTIRGIMRRPRWGRTWWRRRRDAVTTLPCAASCLIRGALLPDPKRLRALHQIWEVRLTGPFEPLNLAVCRSPVASVEEPPCTASSFGACAHLLEMLAQLPQAIGGRIQS